MASQTISRIRPQYTSRQCSSNPHLVSAVRALSLGFFCLSLSAGKIPSARRRERDEELHGDGFSLFRLRFRQFTTTVVRRGQRFLEVGPIFAAAPQESRGARVEARRANHDGETRAAPLSPRDGVLPVVARSTLQDVDASVFQGAAERLLALLRELQLARRAEAQREDSRAPSMRTVVVSRETDAVGVHQKLHAIAGILQEPRGDALAQQFQDVRIEVGRRQHQGRAVRPGRTQNASGTRRKPG